jgi:transcriptional regulator with GAF, ATPase, and Fis domain/tetratricopeptide (TPR) repeat protein
MHRYQLQEVLGTANELIRHGRFEDALASLPPLVGLRESVLEVTACRLIALTGLSRWQDVIEEASAALDTHGRDSESRSALASTHSLLGNAYLRTGELAGCESHLRAAIHIFTWDLGLPVEALAPTRILAALYSNMGMWTTARHELGRAIIVADDNNAVRESLGLRVNLGVILLKSSNRGDALKVIDDASHLADFGTFSKQRALCALLRARVLRMSSAYLPALQALAEALLDIRAANMPREEAICLEYLGDCYLGQRDYRKALEHYQQAMKIAEETAPRGDLVPELCHRLAEALVNLGDANQAILLCERGLRLARETSDRYEECATHRVLAIAHRAAGNPTKAHRIAMEGISLGRSYEIPYELARVLVWDGETRLQSKGRDDQMIGRLQLWEARAVFERIGLQNEVRTLDRALGFEEEIVQPGVESGVAALTEISNLDRGALRFGIITSSPEVSEAVATIQSIAPSKIPVLISGPSGVGKELLAHALHRMSDRRKMPFLPVNCGAISASLIESELFGHERGAFTGAVALREGLFTAADKGTLFLDEIGELPLSTQATLLRVLETGELRRVGSDEVRSIDVRIVAATNSDLEEMVERGLFRRDLFFRLEGVNVKVPPLREREEDIRALFRFFFAEAVAASRKKISVSDDVEPLLCAYVWPGNVRELKNEIARAVVMAENGAVLGREAFLPKLRRKSPTALREARDRDDATAEERSRILEALRAHSGNKADAARSLGGMKRTTLLYKIDRLRIRPEEYKVGET